MRIYLYNSVPTCPSTRIDTLLLSSLFYFPLLPDRRHSGRPRDTVAGTRRGGYCWRTTSHWPCRPRHSGNTHYGTRKNRWRYAWKVNVLLNISMLCIHATDVTYTNTMHTLLRSSLDIFTCLARTRSSTGRYSGGRRTAYI